MSSRTSNLRRAELVMLVAGIALIGFAGFVHLGGRIYSRGAIANFRSNSQAAASDKQPTGQEIKTVDFSLWSPARIEHYKASLLAHLDRPLAVLRMDKIHLEVPVFEGTDDVVLDRGVGWIQGTARIGETGNIGIAGHRDGFFRGLKDVVMGDVIEIETPAGKETYTIDSIKLVAKNDVSVLKNDSVPSLTLVTCFPFYFVGSAPQRYIVHASLSGETNRLNTPGKASLQATASRTKENTQ